MFEKRHYKVIASLLHDVMENYLEYDDTYRLFRDYFERTEKNFNEEKFQAAVWD